MKPAIDQLVNSLRKKGMAALKYMNKAEQKQLWNWSQEVVGQYENTIKNTLTIIKGIKDLPFPKEDIKNAIKIFILLYRRSGSEETIEILKSLFVGLASFQEIDPEDKEVLHKVNLNDSEELNQKISPIYQKYIDIVVAERKILELEIRLFISDISDRE